MQWLCLYPFGSQWQTFRLIYNYSANIHLHFLIPPPIAPASVPGHHTLNALNGTIRTFSNISPSSSSSCHAASTDIPDPLSPLLSIVLAFWQVLRAIYRILTELLYVGSSWSPWFCSAM